AGRSREDCPTGESQSNCFPFVGEEIIPSRGHETDGWIESLPFPVIFSGNKGRVGAGDQMPGLCKPTGEMRVRGKGRRGGILGVSRECREEGEKMDLSAWVMQGRGSWICP
ncbi:unnamed protein product, partial [Linum tenue]